jgi:hypothetical protein
MFTHGYSFPNNAEVAFHVLIGEGGEKNHDVSLAG